ncbi:hypothetical protein [Polaromonas sp.]|uniref:hypothetical protein n=1 Tax=Polaromonas sp. TaxID=1869339 RepID=UPI003BB79F58
MEDWAVFGKFDALKLCDLEKKLQMTAARFLSAKAVLDGLQAKALLAGKAYDSDKIKAWGHHRLPGQPQKEPARPGHAPLQGSPPGGKPFRAISFKRMRRI